VNAVRLRLISICVSQKNILNESLLRVTGYPPIIVPTHWDNFRLPYSFSQEAAVNRNLIPFIKTVADLSPGSNVISPVHLKPIVIE